MSPHSSYSSETNESFNFTPIIIIAVLVGIFVFFASKKKSDGNATLTHPPPAGFKPEYATNFHTEQPSSNPEYQNQQSFSSSIPGFLAGAAVGGLASHLLTKRG